VTAQTLVEAGVIRDMKLPLKILGDGDLSKKLDVTAARFSGAAKQKIEAAGGTTTVEARKKWTRSLPSSTSSASRNSGTGFCSRCRC
jgi:large subunit ribosomal protein L15